MTRKSKTPFLRTIVQRKSNEQLLTAEEGTQGSSSEASKAQLSNEESKISDKSKAHLSKRQGESPGTKKLKVSKSSHQSESSQRNPFPPLSFPAEGESESESESSIVTLNSHQNEDSAGETNVQLNTPIELRPD